MHFGSRFCFYCTDHARFKESHIYTSFKIFGAHTSVNLRANV